MRARPRRRMRWRARRRRSRPCAPGSSALDPTLLGLRLGNGDRVEDVIRYDGPDHYAEHAGHLRAWFAADDDEDDDEDGV